MDKDAINRLLAERLFDLDVFCQPIECSQFTPGAQFSVGCDCWEVDCWFAVPKALDSEETDVEDSEETDVEDSEECLLHDYAGTWEGMGLVVGAMRERGWTYWTISQSVVGGLVSAIFIGSGMSSSGEADTAPFAVALAACRAVCPDALKELEQ